MPNASNTDRVRDADRRRRDDRTTRAVLAVQGPQAHERLATVFPEAAAVGRFRVGRGDVGGHAVHRRRHRLHRRARRRDRRARPTRAGDLWEAIVGAGDRARPASAPATRCASRPALPLHGHELGPGITPLQAGLGWVVAWGKADVPRPRRAGRRARARASHRHLVGIATEGRRPPRAELRRARRRRDGRRGDERQLLAGARPRHRPRRSCRRTSSRAPRSTIDVRGTALPGTVVPRRSSPR